MPTIHNKRRKYQPERKAQERRRKDRGINFDYTSTAWRKDRAAHLQVNRITGQSGRLCELCLKKDPPMYNVATVSDHIRPVNEGGEAWDWSNRQALCATCHNQKSGREAHSHFNRNKNNE